ncbi:protein odr-4 homolog isoform X2 [Musca autumnalis]|uniref:protein odr-4 homolog isoform X2 n=1 Tax=Musca autumnalis TaxID=221902 RepID=UPI003CE7982A
MTKLLLSKSDEEYLEKCATQMKFSYGIIIGQKSEPGKYIVVHLAKNDEEESDFPDAESSAAVGPQKVEQINLQSLGNQWLSAGKMIPGSFNVMGLFIAGVSKDYVDDSSEEFKSAKRLFFDMHNLLKQGHQFKSNEYDDTEYIFLTYSSAAKKAASKIYNYVANGGSFSPLDCRFVEKPFEWYTFECNYELNDVFPILDAAEKINIEIQFQKTIDTVRNNLNASEIFLQNECVDDGQILDSYIKQLRQGGERKANSEESYKATIFLPIKCQNTKGNQQQRVHVKEFNGTIRLSGVVSSRIWCNPKNTIGDVKRFIREDIIRSLMARIQVYCDGLTEPNISNDAIFISEPPRRVYFNVNASGQKSIQFSDYIFRGETPTVAAAQAKQILDLDITTDSIMADLEGVPEDETFSDTSFEMQTEKQTMQKLGTSDPAGQRDLTRTMYMLGIAVSLLVLVIAIVVHYFMK